MPKDRPKEKFTLVNMLALVVIVSLLVALLLPALQIAQGVKARMECSSNLKAIGVGLQHYNISLGCFPPGMTFGTYFDPPDFSTGDYGEVRFYRSAYAELFDFMERGPAMILVDDDPDRPWYGQSAADARTPERLFTCYMSSYEKNPLNEAYLTNHFDAMMSWFKGPFTVGPEFGRTDYLLCKGVSDAFCSQPGLIRTWEQINADPELGGFADNERGMFDISLPPESPGEGSSYVCKVSLVTDGLSNTFAIGEGAQGPNWPICNRGSGSDRCEPLCWDGKGEPSLCSDGKADTPLPIYQFWIGSPNVTSGVRGGLYMGSVFGCTLEPLNKSPVTHAVMQTDPADATNCRASIDWDGDGPVNANTPTGVDRVSNFRSDHPGGANFLFADGAVKFIQDGIAPTTYRALSTISGQEMLGSTLP